MKSSEIGEMENSATAPKITGTNVSVLGEKGLLAGFTSGKGGKVKKGAVESERRKSNARFKEMEINGMKLYLLNAKGDIVETTSKACGENEYMFTAVDGILRLWRGNISVFEDGSKDILFHKPHFVVDFNKDNWSVITNIHNFELVPLMRVLNALGVLEKIFGKED